MRPTSVGSTALQTTVGLGVVRDAECVYTEIKNFWYTTRIALANQGFWYLVNLVFIVVSDVYEGIYV